MTFGNGGDYESQKMLDIYIYDYLMKRNMHEVAAIFAREANITISPLERDDTESSEASEGELKTKNLKVERESGERDMEQNQGDVNDIESEGMVYEENELQRNGSSFSEKSLSSGMIREPLLVKSMRTNTTSQIAIVGANVCPIESLDY